MPIGRGAFACKKPPFCFKQLTVKESTVHSPQEEVGSVAWKTMSGLLDGDRPGARTLLAAEPVIRTSTAPPRS